MSKSWVLFCKGIDIMFGKRYKSDRKFQRDVQLVSTWFIEDELEKGWKNCLRLLKTHLVVGVLNKLTANFAKDPYPKKRVSLQWHENESSAEALFLDLCGVLR